MTHHPTECRARRRAFTRLELLALMATAAAILALAIPTLAHVRAGSGVAGSMANIMTLGVAHVLYAADWEGRQVTWTVDDLGAYPSLQDYNQAHDCWISSDPGCHPGVVAGWSADGGLYGYWSNSPAYSWAFHPINFTGGIEGIGSHRFINFRPFHNYLNGRVYDPVFYAPNDSIPLDAAKPLFDTPEEYNTAGSPPVWSSYSMSPAAMYHSDVMRANADGGWQDPWSIDHGFQSPGLFQATYPSLKTLMIEQHWVQEPPAACNKNWVPDWSTYPCEPYHFNQGLDSSPVAMFYDLSVRLLPNAEVLAGDQAVLKQTGEVDGLWHRGTPFGENGFYIDEGFDAVPLSHHILTTGGILGRDTLGDQMPAAHWRGEAFRKIAAAGAVPSSSTDHTPLAGLSMMPAPGDKP